MGESEEESRGGPGTLLHCRRVRRGLVPVDGDDAGSGLPGGRGRVLAKPVQDHGAVAELAASSEPGPCRKTRMGPRAKDARNTSSEQHCSCDEAGTGGEISRRYHAPALSRPSSSPGGQLGKAMRLNLAILLRCHRSWSSSGTVSMVSSSAFHNGWVVSPARPSCIRSNSHPAVLSGGFAPSPVLVSPLSTAVGWQGPFGFGQVLESVPIWKDE